MENENQEKEIKIERETKGDKSSVNFDFEGFRVKNKPKNKKKLVMVLGFVAILAVGAGIFYWFNVREIKGSPDDYVIKGRIIENQRAGLKVQAPEGWDIEKIELLEGSVAFDSPDIEGEWRNNMVCPPLTKGCGIEMGILYKKMNFNEIREEIKDIHFGLGIKSEKFEEIQINNKKALKNTFDSTAIGQGMAVYFIENNKLYSFGVYWAPDDKQRCVKEFEKMMNKVEIK